MGSLFKATLAVFFLGFSGAIFAQAPNINIGGDVTINVSTSSTVLGVGVALGGSNKTETTIGSAFGNLNASGDYTVNAGVGNIGAEISGIQASVVNVGIAVGGSNCNIVHIGSTGVTTLSSYGSC